MARALLLGVFLAALLAASAHGRSAEGVTTATTWVPRGVEATCATRSFARFPGAYRAEDNLVVGPFALVGAGTMTPPGTIAAVGGNKFPALLKPGHTVTLEVAASARRLAALGYGPLPQGEITLANAHDTVTFRACSRRPVTFWSGAVVTPRPACVPLDVYVDGDATPTRVMLEMGIACKSA